MKGCRESTIPATSSKFYSEDIVFRINKRGNFEHGLVIENYDDASSDEEEEILNELLSIAPLKKGHIRVAWHPFGRKQVISENKVHLLNRCFTPGDIVKKALVDDPNLGLCFRSSVATTLQVIGTKKIIINVDSEELRPLEEFPSHRVIYYENWVGIVREARTKLELFASDGSRCTIICDDTLHLEDVYDARDLTSEFKKYEYFPGQQLWGTVHDFSKAEWKILKKETKAALSNPIKLLEMTVESAKTFQLKVQWLCPAFSQNLSTATQSNPPNEVINEENIPQVKKLDFFFANHVQIGDRMYYTLKEDDIILNLAVWKNNIFQFLNSEKDETSQKAKVSHKRPLTQENGLGSDDHEYESIDSDDDMAFGKSQASSSHMYKEVGTCKELHLSKRFSKKRPTFSTHTSKKKKVNRARRPPPKVALKPGDCVSTEILALSTSVDIIWQDGTIETGISSSTLIPIQHLDNHEFFPGDFVVENKDDYNPHEYGIVKKVNRKERVVEIIWMMPYVDEDQQEPEFLREEQMSVYDIKDHPDFRYRLGAIVIKIPKTGEALLSWAGQVVELNPFGMVQVKWADGSTSTCYPQELYRIGGYESDDFFEDYESPNEESSWQTESELSVFGNEDSSFAADKEDNEGFAQNAQQSAAADCQDDEKNPSKDSFHPHIPLKCQENLLKNFEEIMHVLVNVKNHFSQKEHSSKNTTVLQKLKDLYNHFKHIDTILGTTYFSRQDQTFEDTLIRPNNSHDQNKFSTEPATLNEISKDSKENVIVDKGVDDTLNNRIINACKLLLENLTLAFENIQDLIEMINQPSGGEALLKGETSEQTVLKELCATLALTLDNCSSHLPQASSEEKKETEVTKEVDKGHFALLDEVPPYHKFKSSAFKPVDPSSYFKTLRKELKLLSSSLPEGIIVKGYQERMDLFSVLIKGPKKTPYEDGLFFFDFQLPGEYPKVPPICHYISYCSGRLNPNLYDTGKVCVSLLGTWDGKGTEVWRPATSTLLQVLISIQALILVPEPYFNEANYERQKGTHQGRENSVLYNEMVLIKVVQAMTNLLYFPPEVFKKEIQEHFEVHAASFIRRLETCLNISENLNSLPLKYSPTSPSAQELEINGTMVNVPGYLQLPASKGFCLTLKKALESFKAALHTAGIKYLVHTKEKSDELNS